MKIRYLAAVFAAAFAVSGTAALADTYTAAEADGTSVRIHVTSDAGNARYTVYLLKPGKTLPEDSSGETDVFGRIESIDASNDEAGVFASHELAFELSENAQTGVYTVIMGGGELSGRELNITYAANDVLNGALAAVNGASASEAADAAVNYNGTAWSVDTDNEAYKHHKSEVSESIYEIINGKAANAADVARAFEQACALSELKHCGEEEICDKLFLYESYLGAEYSDEVKNKNEDLISVFAELRTAESMKTPQELASVLRASEGIMKLNKSDRDGAVGIIKEYNDVFNIDLASTIDKVDEYQLAKGIIAARPYSTPAEIKETVTELCDELSKPKEENTTTGSGVSGGGSLHGGSSMGGGTTGGGTSTPSVSVRPDGTVIESTTDGVDSALLASLDSKPLFSDITDAAWAAEYIKYAAENGIMTGGGDGTFRPNNAVTRAEFLKILIVSLKLSGSAEQTGAFADVPEGSWFEGYVNTGVGLGIVNGTSETEFSPNAPVTRQDAAVMILRAVSAAELKLHTDGGAPEFTDSADISDYASEAVAELSSSGVINGYEDGSFRPGNSLLRSETAKVIYTMISALESREG